MEYPYTLVKKDVKCINDDISNLEQDKYDSLIQNYCNYCTFIPYMEFDDDGKRIVIWIDPHLENYLVRRYGEDNKEQKLDTFKSLDETGEFTACFNELCDMRAAEKKRIYDILNDTRNFFRRVSAKVVDNEIHVFGEVYNYYLPKAAEYYYMDYCNGEYTLYVSKSSRFMKMYLSREKYEEIYGDTDDSITEQYSSVEEIEELITNLSDRAYRKKVTLALRGQAFESLKANIDALYEQLISGNAHIRNASQFYDNKYEVIEFFGAEAEFECVSVPFKMLPENADIEVITPDQILTDVETIDDAEMTEPEENTETDDTGEEKQLKEGVIDLRGLGEDLKVIIGVSNEEPEFTLSDGRKIRLTLDDLIDGYELGLSSIDEVGSFLLEHKSLKIEELL